MTIIASCVQERIRCFSEVEEQCRWVFADDVAMEPKAAKNLRKEPQSAERLARLAARLPDPLPPVDELEAFARAFAEDEGIGFGQLVHPVRAALTGRTKGPGLFHCFHMLGRAASVARLRAAGIAAQA